MSQLVKLLQRVAFDVVQGQPFLPASHDCYPPPPPPPPIVSPPDNGNGSGPPHGDCQYYPAYQQQFVCITLTLDGHTVTSCQMENVYLGDILVCP